LYSDYFDKINVIFQDILAYHSELIFLVVSGIIDSFFRNHSLEIKEKPIYFKKFRKFRLKGLNYDSL
ncbi:hypothetical protein, partial [Peribacillus frigoritolerans]|uniref:hypothetical protein n=1 Tax=Peribacillus frigoritolerans TaxID=450367 RepID=UPI003631AC9E